MVGVFLCFFQNQKKPLKVVHWKPADQTAKHKERERERERQERERGSLRWCLTPLVTITDIRDLWNIMSYETKRPKKKRTAAITRKDSWVNCSQAHCWNKSSLKR